MSDHEEFPVFSGSGDPREEALWQAYQAMLRRRKDPRARWSAPDGPAAGRPGEPVSRARPPEPRPAAAARPNAARRIAPRSAAAQAAEPGPLVFQPIDTLDADAGAGTAAGRVYSRPSGGGWRAAIGVAALLAGGATLCVLLWPRAPTPTVAHQAGATTPSSPSAQTRPTPAVGPQSSAASRLGPGMARSESAIEPRPQPQSTAPRAQDHAGASPPPGSNSAGRPPARPARHPRRWAAIGEGASRGAPPAGTPPYAQAEPQTVQLEDGKDPASDAQVSLRSASVSAVREFYSALGQGDGARAAAVVVPEKRKSGPLTARELTRVYGSLRTPLRITKIDPINDDTVFVRYQFVTSDDHLCLGAATVNTTSRNGEALVRGVRTLNGC